MLQSRHHDKEVATMRLLISALVLTLAVAVTASVFAIWPVVADAPWEDSAKEE